jgi:hypothetical protein
MLFIILLLNVVPHPGSCLRKGSQVRKNKTATEFTHGLMGNKKATGGSAVAGTNMQISYRVTGALRDSRFNPLATAARICMV